MVRLIRRLTLLLLAAAAVAAVYTVLTRRRAESPASSASSPAGDDAPRPFAAVADTDAEPGDAGHGDAPRWKLPNDDGSCPAGYPIKANDNSMIFHLPGGRSYERTVAERCYASADDAAADGYRRAKA